MLRKVSIENYNMLAILSGVAIMHMYRDDVIQVVPGETIKDFIRKNGALMQKVVDHGLTLTVEYTPQQLHSIISAYIAGSMHVQGIENGHPADRRHTVHRVK